MESDYDPGIKQSIIDKIINKNKSYGERISDKNGVNKLYINESFRKYIDEEIKNYSPIKVDTDGIYVWNLSSDGTYEYARDCCGYHYKLIYKGDKEKMSYKKDENSGLDYMPYEKEEKSGLNYTRGFSDGYSKGYYQARSSALSGFTTTRVKRIIYNNPATIVFWADGTKTVVKCAKGEKFNKYHGFCAALAKHIYENNSRVNALVNSGIDDNPEKTKSKGSSKKK